MILPTEHLHSWGILEPAMFDYQGVCENSQWKTADVGRTFAEAMDSAHLSSKSYWSKNAAPTSKVPNPRCKWTIFEPLLTSINMSVKQSLDIYIYILYAWYWIAPWKPLSDMYIHGSYSFPVLVYQWYSEDVWKSVSLVERCFLVQCGAPKIAFSWFITTITRLSSSYNHS